MLKWPKTEAEALAMDRADDAFRTRSKRVLKREFGKDFGRITNRIATLFTRSPGGSDVSNENSLFARLMAGRTTDGKIIGDDPDVIRWLARLNGREVRLKDEDAILRRLFGGKLSDGTLVGADPDVIRWLASLNDFGFPPWPQTSLVDDDIESEVAEIESKMQKMRRAAS